MKTSQRSGTLPDLQRRLYRFSQFQLSAGGFMLGAIILLLFGGISTTGVAAFHDKELVYAAALFAWGLGEFLAAMRTDATGFLEFILSSAQPLFLTLACWSGCLYLVYRFLVG